MRTYVPRRRLGGRSPGFHPLGWRAPSWGSSGAMPLKAAGTACGVYRSLLAAWQRRDPAAIAAHFAPGGSFKTPDSGGRLFGPVIAAYAEDLFGALRGFELELTQVDAVGDCVVDHWVLSGCWVGEFRAGRLAGVAPTGRSCAVQGIGIFEVEAGRIRAATYHWDHALLLAQLGWVRAAD